MLRNYRKIIKILLFILILSLLLLLINVIPQILYIKFDIQKQFKISIY